MFLYLNISKIPNTLLSTKGALTEMLLALQNLLGAICAPPAQLCYSLVQE